MKPNEIADIVYKLNCELYDKLEGNDAFVKTQFIYTTDGFVDIIEVADICIWNNEDDQRITDEDENYEDLKFFLKKEYNKLMYEGYNLRFDLGESVEIA